MILAESPISFSSFLGYAMIFFYIYIYKGFHNLGALENSYSTPFSSSTGRSAMELPKFKPMKHRKLLELLWLVGSQEHQDQIYFPRQPLKGQICKRILHSIN